MRIIRLEEFTLCGSFLQINFVICCKGNKKIKLILPNLNNNVFDEIFDVENIQILYIINQLSWIDIRYPTNKYLCKKNNKKIKYKNNNIIIPFMDCSNQDELTRLRIELNFSDNFYKNYDKYKYFNDYYLDNIFLQIDKRQQNFSQIGQLNSEANINYKISCFYHQAHLNRNRQIIYHYRTLRKNDEIMEFENVLNKFEYEYSFISLKIKKIDHGAIIILKIDNDWDFDSKIISKLASMLNNYKSKNSCIYKPIFIFKEN